MEAGAANVEARERRAAAARVYQPARIELLLVAEAPPADPNRYFYFPNVATHDTLFRYVCKGIFGIVPDRDKVPWLRRLADRGVFLVDLKLDPVDGSPLGAQVGGLVERCHSLRPERVVLIKATVYDAAFSALKRAGLPVIDKRIPFPGSGQQANFERRFAEALALTGR